MRLSRPALSSPKAISKIFLNNIKERLSRSASCRTKTNTNNLLKCIISEKKREEKFSSIAVYLLQNLGYQLLKNLSGECLIALETFRPNCYL